MEMHLLDLQKMMDLQVSHSLTLSYSRHALVLTSLLYYLAGSRGLWSYDATIWGKQSTYIVKSEDSEWKNLVLLELKDQYRTHSLFYSLAHLLTHSFT